MKIEFEKGDFIGGYGSISKVTEKAVCIKFHNGKWVGGANLSKWVPKSAITVYSTKPGKGLINDESKKYIEAELAPWLNL